MADPSIHKLKGTLGNSTELDAIANPSLQHIGILVRDIEATTEELSKIWGIDSWETLEFAPPQSAMKVGNTFKIKMANANLLGLLLHIAQPLEDVDTFAETSPVWGKWLQKSFGGIQHICVSVNNWDQVVAKVVERGGRIYKSTSYEGKRCAHIEGEIGNLVVEIEERAKPGVTEEKAVGISNVKGKIGNSTELDMIANPSLQHLGVWVRDENPFMRYMTKVWGIDDWETLEFIPPQETMMVGKSFRLGMCNANLLGLLLHVSERLEDVDTFAKSAPLWAEWERTHGEGLYHICVSVSNWEKVVDIVKSRGAHLYASSSYEGRRWAHFQNPVSGIIVEIEERPNLPL